MFSIFSHEKLDQRMYVDMMYRATSQYAAYIPSSQAHLGDYGEIDRKTGEFLVSGNLFKDCEGFTKAIETSIETPEASRSIIASRSKGSSGEVGLSTSIQPVVDASLSGSWKFDKDRHAALVLIDPVLVEIPYEGRIAEFLTEDPGRYKKYSTYAICTRLYKCTSYALLMSNGEGGNASFKFDAKAAVTSNIMAGGKIGGFWEVSAERGVWTTGLYEANVYRYFPLRTLRRIERHGHLRPAMDTGPLSVPYTLPDYGLPWEDLDDSGVKSKTQSDGESTSEGAEDLNILECDDIPS